MEAGSVRRRECASDAAPIVLKKWLGIARSGASPPAANRTGSIAMRSKMPNWTRLLTDSVKLGVSANHVVALRMAKLAHGDAAARAESKLMLDEKVKAAVDANLEAARSIMAGQAHLAPARALSVYQKRVHKNLSRLSKKWCAASGDRARAARAPAPRPRQRTRSREAGEKRFKKSREIKMLEQVPAAKVREFSRRALTRTRRPSPLSLGRDETSQDMHVTIVVPELRIQSLARAFRIARRGDGHGSHHYIGPSFADQSIDVVFWPASVWLTGKMQSLVRGDQLFVEIGRQRLPRVREGQVKFA